ncbi:MAG: hypothetical protein WKF84_01660 [Pyrinomonadaceae bacterium]
MKVPKVSDVPPSAVRKTFDAAKKTTYLTIDIPLSAQSKMRSLSAAAKSSDGEIDITFRLEYKGVSASDLSAAQMSISFLRSRGSVEKLLVDNSVEVQADAYQFSYPDAAHETEQLTFNDGGASAAAPPLTKERVTIKLLPEDLQQIAFANRLDIKIGKEEIRVSSIQLAELRKTLLSYNAN